MPEHEKHEGGSDNPNILGYDILTGLPDRVPSSGIWVHEDVLTLELLPLPPSHKAAMKFGDRLVQDLEAPRDNERDRRIYELAALPRDEFMVVARTAIAKARAGVRAIIAASNLPPDPRFDDPHELDG